MNEKAVYVLLHRLKQRQNRKRDFRKRMRLMVEQHRKISENYLSLALKAISIFNPPVRKVCKLKRNSGYWENALDNFSHSQWMEAFRLPRNLIFQLAAALKDELSPKPNPIISNGAGTAELKIAVTLYKLASCCEYRVIGDVFGIHKSTVHKYFYEVIAAINKLLFKTIQMPSEEECRSIASNFERKSRIPQIIGCIDGTHIPILAPADGQRDFVNRKGWTSVQMQAVVDSNFIFRNVSCKYPGSCHDAYAFKGSSLWQHNDKFICQAKRNINGADVPYVIIGDPAYPLLPWLMKDYSGVNLSEEKEQFNKLLNKSRVNVEIAFGRLKGRWRMLSKRSDVDYLFMPSVVAACCVLHNFIEENNGGFVYHWLEEIENDQEIHSLYQQPGLQIEISDSLAGADIRDILCHYCVNTELNS